MIPRSILCLALAAVLSDPARASDLESYDFADLSLEELGSIQVTSVSKRSQPLADAPGSIYVITAEAIRRSGVTTLAEAMRLAPNLQVSRVDARNYAVAARGFNNPFQNKLLVLIDGRTVYSPLFSGVYWDAQDVVLEDIDRIEVISGPGATLWGSNAVNGVINILTKSADATQGGLAAAGASHLERHGVVRYGGTSAGGASYRIYGKSSAADDTRTAAGISIPTGWDRRQTGFRTDWGDVNRRLTLQGDAYTGDLRQFGTRDIRIGGANLLGHMTNRLDDGSLFNIQAYWDYTKRDQPLAFVEHLHTLDLQVQHALKPGRNHDLVWGGGYRVAFDDVVNESNFAFLPGDLTMRWGNLFVQDEVALRDNLHVTGGLKLEHNSYTGIEFLPTLRVAWKPSTNQLVWGAASRSVRSPSRIDRDFYSPANPAVVAGVPQYAVAGGPEFESEVANVVELGLRGQPSPTLSYSLTAFASRYDDLRTLEPNPNGPGLVFANLGRGRTHGLEAWGSWQIRRTWRLSGGFVVQRVRTELKAGSQDATGTTGLATADPSHFWSLRSSHDLADDQELDFTLRHTSSLPNPRVPSYTALDIRYAWKLRRDLELSIVGQNLLDRRHAEFGAEPGRSEFERSLFVKLFWQQ